MYEHDFEKQNLVTIQKRGRFYDELKCRKCGKVKLRYGLTIETYGCRFPDPIKMIDNEI